MGIARLKGIPFLGFWPFPTFGNVFYVSSTHGSANPGNPGTNPEHPVSSLASVFSRDLVTAGDVVFLLPGHIETITGSAGCLLDIAGVTIVGLGNGSSRPQFNFTTSTGASLSITGANTTIYNVLFTGGIDALTGPISIAAADCRLLNIETQDVTGQATDFIVTTSAASRLFIGSIIPGQYGWIHRGASAAGADTAISIVGGDGIVISDFWIDGNFTVAAIENVTTAATNITIGGGYGVNYVRTRNAADVIITLHADATGNIGPNINARLQDNAANITEAFVGAKCQFFQPINIVNADGESSLQTNITASVDEN